MKRILILLAVLLTATMAFTSCSKDDKPANQQRPEGNSSQVDKTKDFTAQIPMQFGKTYDQIVSLNPNLHFSAFDEKTRSCTLSLMQDVQNPFTSAKLYFNLQKEYEYASIQAKSFDDLKSGTFLNNLETKGWQATTGFAPKDGEIIYQKDQFLARIFPKSGWAVTHPTLIIGPNTQNVESWMRLNALDDKKTGIWSPLAAIGCQKELFDSFEQFWGHSINAKRTKPDKGFFAFNTGNPKFPLVGYYYDLETNTYLEESTIYMDYNNPPSEADLETYVKSLGFEKTPLKDKNGDTYFYNRKTKVTCGLFIHNPNNLPPNKFNPRMDFMLKTDIEASLPKESVDIPWPNTDFGKITIDEAVKWYKSHGYTIKIVQGINEVETGKPDFPKIWLFPDSENNYGGCFLITMDPKVAMSPDIVRQLKAKGYTEKKGPAIPTFENKKLNVQAQLDTQGLSGVMGIGFNLIGA